MTDLPTPTPAAPVSEPAPAVTPAVPEGFVPQAEVDQAREESRRRYQGENDTLKAELAKLKAGTPAPAATATAAEGFDPEAFRSRLLSDVYGATALATAASEARAAFPHADPALFTPERLSQFTTPDAFHFAVKDSHDRVAAILQAERATMETKIREEIAGAGGGPSPVTPGGPVPAPAGDPTPQEMAAMSVTQMEALERANPGVTDRVLSKLAVGA